MKLKIAHIFAYIAFLIMGLTICSQCSQIAVKSRENAILATNLSQARDTIQIYELKNDQLAHVAYQYELESRDLQSQLDIYDDQLKSLQKKMKTKINSATKIDAEIKVDTIYIDSDPIWTNDTLIMNFNYSDQWMNLYGKSVYKGNQSITSIDNISMLMPLTIGTTKDNRVFATTPNPYVKITDIHSVRNIKKSKFGMTLGVGAFYDMKSKKLGYGPGAVIGFNYTF